MTGAIGNNDLWTILLIHLTPQLRSETMSWGPSVETYSCLEINCITLWKSGVKPHPDAVKLWVNKRLAVLGIELFIYPEVIQSCINIDISWLDEMLIISV